MNIFVTHSNPSIAANNLCDTHVVSQAKETAQMMVSAMIRHNVPSSMIPLTKAGNPSKGGHPHHRCTRWAGETRSNFLWLLEHGSMICANFFERRKKVHFNDKSFSNAYEAIEYIPDGPLTPFVVAIKEDQICRQRIDGFDSLPVQIQYRLYIKHDKPFAQWTMNRPYWIDLSDDEIVNTEDI